MNLGKKLKDRNKLIGICEQTEAKLWCDVVASMSKLTSITYSRKNIWLYLYPDYPISSFNRIMGYNVNWKPFQKALKFFLDLNINIPLFLSVPPLKKPYLEFLSRNPFQIHDFESIYFTDLRVNDLSRFSLSSRISRATLDNLDEIVDLYTKEVFKSNRYNPELLSEFFRIYYTAILKHSKIYLYQIRGRGEMIALGGLYYESGNKIGYIFSDMTHPKFRNQGLQRELIVHRGMVHNLDLLFATITADGYTSSIGNALGIGASHLYDRTIYKFQY